MGRVYSLKIDAFCHILPVKFKELVEKDYPSPLLDIRNPTLYDLDHRFRIMDKYQGLVHVLSLATPPLEAIANPSQSAELAKMANDQMAELVFRYPDRFVAAVAALPLNDIDASLREIDRAVNDLKFRGIQIFTNINGKPLDSPEFMPIYQKMAEYNLPVWIHPFRPITFADYKSEEKSTYVIHLIFGWPYESTVAMMRLVFGGVLEKYPNLKLIAHHCGAMIPSLWQRITHAMDGHEMVGKGHFKKNLTRPPIDYFRMFYTDTAINDNPAGLMCGLDFYGVDHLLFASDMPYDNQNGDRKTRECINAVEKMNISDADKKKIFEDNIIKLLRLPV